MRLPAPLLRRNKRVHKRDFGHVLVAAGSPTMLGAACLVSLAAMRAGAGLVTAAVPKKINLTLQAKISHAMMTLPVPGTGDGIFAAGDAPFLLKRLSLFSAVAIGPGLGRALSTQAFVLKMLKVCPLPMVVDADALNALAGRTDLLALMAGPRILTPHAGEFTRLTGEMPTTNADRRCAAAAFAVKHRSVLILKGYHTVIASPDGKSVIDKSGGPELAKAGTGDVLTGIIAGLLAQGVLPFEAATAGVALHAAWAKACLRHRQPFSLTAVDLVGKGTVPRMLPINRGTVPFTGEEHSGDPYRNKKEVKADTRNGKRGYKVCMTYSDYANDDLPAEKDCQGKA